jgi:hypothetical protein
MTAVPPAYRGWVNTAAKGTGLPSSVVAAQINTESRFNPKATSPVGAQGIAQFMPGTWKGQGIAGSPYDPNAALQGYVKLMGSLLNQFGGNVRNALAAYNAGPGNLRAGYGYADKILSAAGDGAPTRSGVGGGGLSLSPSSRTQTITTTKFDQAGFDKAQRAAIAGQYLSQSNDMWQLGPKSSISGPNLFGPGLLTTTAPNPADYTTTVQTKLQQLAGDTNLSTHPGSIPAGQGDINPLAHGWKLGRTDQGVDASAPTGTAVLAINDSVVKDVVPNWYNGQPLVLMQLTAGPNKGKYYYLAEQVHNGSGSAYSGGRDWRVGQTFRRGQVIGRYAPVGTGIEIGWGSPNSAGRTLAQQTGQTGDASHGNAPAGIDFRKTFLGG